LLPVFRQQEPRRLRLGLKPERRKRGKEALRRVHGGLALWRQGRVHDDLAAAGSPQMLLDDVVCVGRDADDQVFRCKGFGELGGQLLLLCEQPDPERVVDPRQFVRQADLDCQTGNVGMSQDLDLSRGPTLSQRGQDRQR